MNYTRKRAVTACVRCRARKTKCDNQRPACGFCTSVGASCDYEENVEHSSFDPASLHILSRLNEILERQDDVLSAVHALDAGNISKTANTPGNFSLLSNTASSSAPDQHFPFSPQDGGEGVDPTLQWENSANYLKIPSSRTIPDLILAWPIFDGKYLTDCLQDAIFDSTGMIGSSDSASQAVDRPLGTKPVTSGLSETEISGLIENFLAAVHTKNPILDENMLKRSANSIIEDGLSWDGPSCLVLLACALGAIAIPFEASFTQITFDPHMFRQLERNHAPQNFEKADTYYLLARRRIGLLSQSIVASQCHFLSGVFLMFALKPVQAFHEFHHASLIFQVYLKCNRSSPKSPQTQRLEQRMYWSCFKSECEILSEIPLPESGIADFEYPHLFPSPPDPRNFAVSLGFNESALDPTSSLIQQQSWFYYLSEIALRRIGNRVLNAFYRDDYHLWAEMKVSSMIRVGQEFMNLLDQWHEGLPSQLSYNQDNLRELPAEELPFMIRARVLEIVSCIFRPFLFYAIHSQPLESQESLLHPFVEQALQNSMRLIETNSIRHRHHGVWYTCRVSVSAALSILAAAKSSRISLPQGWQSAVQLAIETLLFWENDGPGDLRVARVILEELFAVELAGFEDNHSW
ncbi:hypothetical protein DL98DRAFT_470364 [Cadophora sp. DSE1049]|nr:hypothetical protein DL98DRAFT_470364 [Cadophora sp. DSE1049]